MAWMHLWLTKTTKGFPDVCCLIIYVGGFSAVMSSKFLWSWTDDMMTCLPILSINWNKIKQKLLMTSLTSDPSRWKIIIICQNLVWKIQFKSTLCDRRPCGSFNDTARPLAAKGLIKSLCNATRCHDSAADRRMNCFKCTSVLTHENFN